MNSQMLAYLQQDGIGKVIAKGLATVYTHKPETPVAFLIQWLRNYSATQHHLHSLTRDEHDKKQSLHNFHKTVQIQDQLHAQRLTHLQKHNNQFTEFQQMIASHEYHEELLQEILPEFAERFFGLTGVYIGYLNHPSKAITEDDEDENAHLNTAIPKLINYVGSSKSHRHIMHGKTLPLDKGVTSAAFNLQSAEQSEKQPAKYVYLPNVVKNESVHYFRLPKLGAYIAVPLIYNSYLKQHVFDVLEEAKKIEMAGREAFTKAKQADLEEFQRVKIDHERKIVELQQKGSDEGPIQECREQLKQNEAKRQARLQEQFVVEPVEIPTEKREFVVCADSLGSDKEIPLEDREKLAQLVKHFQISWEAQEKILIEKDIAFHIHYEKDLTVPSATEREQLEKRLEIPPEVSATFETIQDEPTKTYRTEEWQLKALREQLHEAHQYIEAFTKLAHFRVVKYKELIQTILHFLKHKKEEINLPGRTVLNWKKARIAYITAPKFKEIIAYETQGPKTDVYPPYCKASALLDKLEKFDEAKVFDYNIGLGAILKFMKSALTVREGNVEFRKAQKESERKARDQLIQENEKITEEKRQALEKHKSSLAPEDFETFNEEEWSAKYDEEFPLKEISPEIVDDIDNDM